MRMLATGSNALPAEGIGAVAVMLARKMPASVVHTNTRVEQVRQCSQF